MPCHLHPETTRLSFNTSDGDKCKSTEDITLTRCEGFCDTYDGVRIRPVSGQSSSLQMDEIHDTECGCCFGTGEWVQQAVNCDKAGATTVELYKYTMCGCVACESIDTETLQSTPETESNAVPPLPPPMS